MKRCRNRELVLCGTTGDVNMTVMIGGTCDIKLACIDEGRE